MSVLLKRIHTLRKHYWFVPSLMAGAAVGLSFLIVALDDAVKGRIEPVWWMYSGGQQVARRVLSAIAASMIAIVSLAFSITMMVITFLSQHYGARVLRNFRRDPKSQLVLGAFIATFLYTLLVLRTVHAAPDEASLPRIAVTLAIMLALASFGVLIYFLYHVAEFIEAPNIIAAVSRDLEGVIGRLTSKDNAIETIGLPAEFERRARSVSCAESGYLQEVDEDSLMALCRKHDVLIRLKHNPGAFLLRGDILADAWPEPRVDVALNRRLRKAFIIGTQRTIEQDVEFAVNQLVQVAIRALSPGHNDTFTAMLCLDRLGAALCLFADGSPLNAYRHDRDRKLRIIARPITFGELVECAFGQIREFGRKSTAVRMRLLQTLETVALHTRREEDRVALLRQAVIIVRGGRGGLSEESDRQRVKKQFQAVVQTIRTETAPQAGPPRGDRPAGSN
ncbi:MAG: DUF2254 domain-containing protein [Nitrospiraceae bacterium]